MKLCLKYYWFIFPNTVYVCLWDLSFMQCSVTFKPGILYFEHRAHPRLNGSSSPVMCLVRSYERFCDCAIFSNRPGGHTLQLILTHKGSKRRGFTHRGALCSKIVNFYTPFRQSTPNNNITFSLYFLFSVCSNIGSPLTGR